MKLTLVVDDQKWNSLLSKAALEGNDPDEMLLFKVNEYLDACARDVGADDLAKVSAALADPANLATAKAALNL